MRITVDYPLYLVGQLDPDNMALIDLVNGPSTAKGIAVFSDKDGAEEFRDKYHHSFVIIPLRDEVTFANLLVALKTIVSQVVFDPYIVGKAAHHVISLDEMLSQLPPAMQS